MLALIGGPLKTIQLGSLKAMPTGSGPVFVTVSAKFVMAPASPFSPENEPKGPVPTVKIPGVPVVEANRICVKFTVADPVVPTNPVIGVAPAQIENKLIVRSVPEVRSQEILPILTNPSEILSQ